MKKKKMLFMKIIFWKGKNWALKKQTQTKIKKAKCKLIINNRSKTEINSTKR